MDKAEFDRQIERMNGRDKSLPKCYNAYRKAESALAAAKKKK